MAEVAKLGNWLQTTCTVVHGTWAAQSGPRPLYKLYFSTGDNLPNLMLKIVKFEVLLSNLPYALIYRFS